MARRPASTKTSSAPRFSNKFKAVITIIILVVAGFLVIPSILNSIRGDVFYYPDYHKEGSMQLNLWQKMPNIDGMNADQIVEVFKNKPLEITCPDAKKILWTGYVDQRDISEQGQTITTIVGPDTYDLTETVFKDYPEYVSFVKNMTKEEFNQYKAILVGFILPNKIMPNRHMIAAIESPVGTAGALCYSLRHFSEFQMHGGFDLFFDGAGKFFIYQDQENWDKFTNWKGLNRTGNSIPNNLARWNGYDFIPCSYTKIISDYAGVYFIDRPALTIPCDKN